jgi:HNH endonuclease
MRSLGNCNGTLGVHHRVPLADGGTNQLDNLLTLCRIHHEQVESGFFLTNAPHPSPGFRETETKNTSGGGSVG